MFGMIRAFLANKPLNPLGQLCLNHLFTVSSAHLIRSFADMKRLSTVSSAGLEAKAFLRHLQSDHPQLLYKTLFACAAAISVPSLGPPLKLVLTLSENLGSGQFWTYADPQMVAIVLMVNASASNKGKGKEGEIPRLAVKLGRYAVSVQLLKALDKLDAAAKIENRLKTFAEQLESRIAVTLETEVSGPKPEEGMNAEPVGKGCEIAERLSRSYRHFVSSPPRDLGLY